MGIALVIVGVIVTVCVTRERSPGDRTPLREVLSSRTQGERALAVSTSSLYAANDPWKRYLADEATCPGGERADLPATHQVSTVACLINYARERRGLHPLVIRRALSAASVVKANEILRCESFAHNPCGLGWMTAVRSTGYRGAFGENLYLATGRWGAPRVAVDAWLNSAAHRENLFGRQWRGQGLALVSSTSFSGHSDVSLWVSVMGKE